ncbi:hypothetical protein D3C78_1552610 [compost metagenome]
MPVSFKNADGSIAQTLIDLKALAANFAEQQSNANGALLGSFEAVLEARRINSIAPVVRVTVQADVTLEQPV